MTWARIGRAALVPLVVSARTAAARALLVGVVVSGLIPFGSAWAQLVIAPGLNPPPALPDPPPVQKYLFENPYPGVAVLVVAAAVLWFVGRQRWSVRAVLGGAAGLLALAGGLWALATFTQTPREAVVRAAREIVGAVAAADEAKVGALLDEDAALYAFFSGRGGMRKADILRMVGAEMRGVYKLREHRVAEVRAVLEGPRVARAHVLVMVDPEQSRLQTWSWWRLDFARRDEAWLVRGIEPLSIQGMENPGPRP